MGPRVTLAFVALFCGLFPPIYGSKAPHPSVKNAHAPHPAVHHLALHPVTHHAGGKHPGLAHAAAHLPLKQSAPAHHPAPHHAAAHHPAPHHAAAHHPAAHLPPKHLALAHHPALHPSPARHPLEHLAVHPHLKHLPAANKSHPGHPKLHLPYRIPDILDRASAAFASADSLLKKYVRDGKVAAGSLRSALYKAETFRQKLLHANLHSEVYGLYQRSLGLVLERVVQDLEKALNDSTGFGRHNTRKPTRKITHPKVSPYANAFGRPKVATKPHMRTPAEFIPVAWEAVVSVRPTHVEGLHPLTVSHPHLVSHPHPASHPRPVSHPHLVSHSHPASHLHPASHPHPVSHPHLASHPHVAPHAKKPHH